MKMKQLLATTMIGLAMTAVSPAWADQHTELTPDTAVRMDTDVTKFFPTGVNSPCGESCFIIRTSNDRYGEIIYYLNQARIDGTAVDVHTYDTCYELNAGCSVVKFISPR